MCRSERQAFGATYRINIFRDIGRIYVWPQCECVDLRELILLCGGQTTDRKNRARYIIGKYYENTNFVKGICLKMTWILDSISISKLKKIEKYLLKS